MMTAVSYPEDKNIVKPMYVMPHMEIGIINKNGKFVNRGEKGEIIVRGYSVMHGYWNDEEKTQQVLDKDRWYHTGWGTNNAKINKFA
uniref:Medium-chain acyl-CoA ligase ACSF2, mitochondrial n=1 Tax=Panagrolaimus superbus TaxID=310955 RepID=A0A914YXZ4_9BILA